MKLNRLIFIFLGIVFFPFCNSNHSNKVAFLNPDKSKERWQKDEAFFIEQAKAKGFEVITADAKGNEENQYNQAIELINQGVKVLVIAAVNANTAASIVREAHKNSVKVIAYDRLIKNAEIDYYVSPNNMEVGELIATYVTKLKPKGNYVLLYGDRADPNSAFVKEGILKVIKPLTESGNIHIIYNSFIESWKGINSEFEMNQFLSLSKDSVDVVISCGDDIAQGVIRALKANHISKKVLVTGQNGDLAAIKSILKDEQTMTVYKPIKDLAGVAANLAFELLNNQKPTGINTEIFNKRMNVPTILIPVIEIDKNNIDEVLIKGGVYSHDKVYN